MTELPVLRLRQAAISLLLVVTTFHQSPGLISNDTKIDLTADPGRFLARALDLWNPSSAFGQLQNQAYGYLFPMGSFHLLGYWLGLPGWIVQRAWMSLLLVTAFLGVLRLAARLELGTSTTRLLGGLAYALSPRILTELGGNSSEILPMALLPWVLIPLVGPRAQEQPRRAAMRSAVAVLCMGAINATAVLALMPLPVLFLLPGLRRAAGRRLAAWWVVAMGLACTWWLVPLLLQGRYTSSNFLDYIETAATTTSTTSVSEVLRGTSHWLAYIATPGGPWWRSGWTLVTSGGVILNTAVLAALCAVGLLRKGMPAQGRLAAAAAVGLLAMSVGHAGPLDGPFVGPAHDLLDGALAPFRNVHKFDPLLRLPLALGLCHLLGKATPGRARQAVSGLVVLALIGTAAPAIAGQLVPVGGYQKLPSWWDETGAWLDDHAGRERSLVLPATGFGEYLWGRPLDNPLQALTTRPWAVRDAVPLGSPGTTRLLDAIDARVDTGRGSAALAPVLARSGVRYLVVSNDLDRTRTGAPRPALVHQALDSSPGLHRVAAFGPLVGSDDSQRSVVTDRGLDTRAPAVEVYEVDGATSPVSALPEAGTWVLSGGPESLFQLAERGLLGNQATVLAGDGPSGPSPRSAQTDALRRREIGFGSVRNNASATLTAHQPLTREQAAPDVLPVAGVQHLATARLIGAKEVSASSSASDAGAVLDRGPDKQPFAAFDGDPSSAWVTGSVSGATGQWVQLELDQPVDPKGLTLQLFGDDSVRGRVTSVLVTTDGGSVATTVRPDESRQLLGVAPGLTTHLRVTVRSLVSDGFGTLAGIRDLSLPGVVVQSTVDLPHDQPQRGDQVILLDRAAGAEAGCVRTDARSVCSPALTRATEDIVRLDRSFVLDAPAVLPVTGSARPVAGAALNHLLDAGSPVQATASSALVPDPAVRPATVLDGDDRTGWIASDQDKAPALTLTWPVPRAVDQVSLATAPALSAARPTEVAVVTTGGTSTLEVPADGVLRFPSVVTNRVELRFLKVEKRTSFQPDGGVLRLPVGLTSVDVPGVTDQSHAQPPAEVNLPCGTAPPVLVDGVVHPTAALGSRADLLALQPILLSLCDAPKGLSLSSGRHRVAAADLNGLAVEGLTLGVALPTSTSGARPTQVVRWDAEHRVVLVGKGDASYLVVHENLNRGWQARLDGRLLTPARIDGWQQAWVVPTGEGGKVVLTFAPGRTFHLALAGGLLLVLLLLALALLPSGRPATVVEALAPRRLPVVVRIAAALVVTVGLGGAVGVVCYLALVGVVLAARRSGEEELALDGVPLLAGAALVGAGLLTAYAPWNGARAPAAFGTPVQVLALVALGTAAAVLSVPRSSSAASEPAPAAPPAAD
jgi:arabinofuranan 3-O-arabinosyltransferase